MLSFNKYLSSLNNQRKFARLLRSTLRFIYSLLEIATILLTVILLILGIIYIENTIEQKTEWGKAFLQSLEDSEILGTIENISIVTALVIYIRWGKKKSHYQAWQVIDSAQGLQISYARIKALEELVKGGVCLKGLSLPKTNLDQVNLVDVDFKEANLQGTKLLEANLRGGKFELTQLQGAFLWGANLQDTFFLLTQLQKANLSSANLKNADMEGVNLLEANLQKANLEGAYILGNLQGVDLQEANLKGANLQGCYLKNANFQSANLKGANLQEANLQGANFHDANLQDTNLQKTKGLNPLQIKSANNWQQAKYSREFYSQLNLPEK
ncbi:MAG: pentapeptide repeat-containing protein [Okeania sp. SIO2D1]|uniref:pentapeptide repeat-containing protein n=1 Tax=Okeania sp. SIO2C9 TaxID=2607791 RepID=UPI0013BBEC0B|nr:pentapeptide repeat-containing protein [Okeania sp. SIO2C9]NEQ72049.1 pentapeptide repeat-containing protein [Okeania sp. SIO2C9]NES68195.1 pentapeptide repeat-containing protein [Okeania sp. SIO2D1]